MMKAEILKNKAIYGACWWLGDGNLNPDVVEPHH